MVDPIVRPADPGDLPSVADLEREARASLVGARGGDRWLETNPAHGGVRPGASVFVGTVDDVVVGYLVVDLSTETARVVDVFVHPEARELGFGDELLALARSAAVSAGAVRLEAEALPGDRETKNLYERAGIKARLIVVSTEL